jgi:hypothetical protein
MTAAAYRAGLTKVLRSITFVTSAEHFCQGQDGVQLFGNTRRW